MATPSGATAVGRSQIEDFFTQCIALSRGSAEREVMRDPAAGRPGPRIVELQKGVWEALRIPVASGRAACGNIDAQFPGDAALISLRQEFGEAMDVFYLQCLEDRRPSVLESKEKMPRSIVLEFLDACNLKIDRPEWKDRVREHIWQTGAMPDDVINEMNSEVMELLGFEREHGQRCFRELGEKMEFEHDREVAVSFGRWRGKTSSVCIALLNAFQNEGGELNVDQGVKEKILELRAKEELAAMSQEERGQLLERNAKKVNIVRGLPPEARIRYVEKLGEEEKIELCKSEILMVSLAQHRQQREE